MKINPKPMQIVVYAKSAENCCLRAKPNETRYIKRTGCSVYTGTISFSFSKKKKIEKTMQKAAVNACYFSYNLTPSYSILALFISIVLFTPLFVSVISSNCQRVIKIKCWLTFLLIFSSHVTASEQRTNTKHQ